jgi:hypothetical protein
MVRVAPKTSKSGVCHRELPCRRADQAADDDRRVIAVVNRTSRRWRMRSGDRSKIVTADDPGFRRCHRLSTAISTVPRVPVRHLPSSSTLETLGGRCAEPGISPASRLGFAAPAVTWSAVITDRLVAVQADRSADPRAGLSRTVRTPSARPSGRLPLVTISTQWA